MKKLLSLVIVLVFFSNIHSQTLFTYGNKAVSKKEFIEAFEKNPPADTNRQSALREYLDLYINYKLKVQQAQEEKLYETLEYKADSANFFKQLTENVMNEEAGIDRLVDEAYQRSKKDLEVAQVYVEIKNGDTLPAYKKIEDAYAQLKAGKSFEEVSSDLSSDSSTRAAKGYIGYVTVFTLPYEIENILYSLPPDFSKPYHSNVGYHIFKLMSQRPALGRRKIQQILFPVPAFFTEEEKKGVLKTADSVYALLRAGASFEDLASKYGNSADNSDDNAGIDVSVGQYSSDFENQVYQLHNIGDISRPFETSYGYHIIKLSDKELQDSSDQTIAKAQIQQRVENDERLMIARKNLVKKWMEKTKFQPASYDEKQLWIFTDNALNKTGSKASKIITDNTLLFSFETSRVYVKDWLKFLETFQQSGNEMLNNPYPVLMKEFINEQCIDYYRSRLPDYNTELKKQLKEFNEANLLFAVMDKHIWNKAAEDTDGLKKYYNEHKSEYIRKPDVGSIILTASKKETAEEVAAKIKADPLQWRNIISSYGSNVSADSSRFEADQLPGIEKMKLEKGEISSVQYNPSANTYSFFCITDIYPNQNQRSFEDAHGMVVNDYQKVVEQQWIEQLRKKYPVKVNYTVFNTIK